MDNYIRHIEEVTLPALRQDLEAFETRRLRIYKLDASHQEIDMTPEHADGIRKAIAEYESILTSLRKGETP